MSSSTPRTCLVCGRAYVPDAACHPLRQAYVSLSGVVSDEDVETVRTGLALVPDSHRLAAGVLVSSKTLGGEPTESLRYPPIAKVPGLLARLHDVGAWPVVHFNTRTAGMVFLGELVEVAAMLPRGAGIQLNCQNPDRLSLAALKRHRPDIELILQIRQDTTLSGPTQAHSARAYVAGYGHLIQHALLDLSQGSGQPMDCDLAAQTVRSWGTHPLLAKVRLGLAGRLGPNAHPALVRVRDDAGVNGRMGEVSLCAESAIRAPVADADSGLKGQDTMDRDLAHRWLKVAAVAVRP